jgi:hypothetical protein
MNNNPIKTIQTTNIETLQSDTHENQDFVESDNLEERPTMETVSDPSIPTVVLVNETEWYLDVAATRVSINNNVPFRNWGFRTSVGDIIGEESDLSRRFSRLDYFLLSFPPAQLREMVRLTNIELTQDGKRETSAGEILKYMGIIVLMTQFEFSERAELWSKNAPSKYKLAPAFGRTGMSRNRFDDLHKSVRWSEQPPNRPDGMTHSSYRWMLVDGFVNRFNQFRASSYIPSDRICVDESISRWYGQGGSWINRGLPEYIAINRKPESGCEIQNEADGRSGIMIRLCLVKSSDDYDDNHDNEVDGLPHGTKVLKSLVEPWSHSDRIVCADSYFASVKTAEEMRKIGLHFIGVVKTAKKCFPMEYLSTQELQNRGDRIGLVTKDAKNKPTMLAFVWVDRDRRYFIATTSSLEAGQPYSRFRWQQLGQDPNAEPENIEVEVPQPLASEIYYDVCATIDQHNRHRQDTLNIEKKVKTHDWSKRVNLTVFAMCVVDAWLLYSKATKSSEKQKDFYMFLADELIDNNYDGVGVHSSSRRASTSSSDGKSTPPAVSRVTGAPLAGIGAHLTPGIKKRKNSDTCILQGRCVECGKKTTMACSACQDEAQVGSDQYVCSTKNGATCFSEHLKSKHSL